MPDCEKGECWSAHNIEGYLDTSVKNKMCRNGAFEFLIKHMDRTCSAGSVLTSDVRGSIQKAMNNGCPVNDVLRRLESMKILVEGGVIARVDSGKELVLRLGGDELEAASHLLDDNDVMNGLGVGTDWAMGAISPVYQNGSLQKGPGDYCLTSPVSQPVELRHGGNTPPPPPTAPTMPPPAAGGTSPPPPVTSPTMPQPGNATAPPLTTVRPPAEPKEPTGTTVPPPAAPRTETKNPATPTRDGVPSPPAASRNEKTNPATPICNGVPPQSVRQSPLRRAKSSRRTLTTTQTKAAGHINSMMEASRKGITTLEKYKKKEAEPITKSGRRYPDAYTGLRRCHLRALFNVSESAAAEACKKKIAHKDTTGVLEVLRKYKGEAKGKVFHVQKEHWVALEIVEGTNDAVYYDDKVYMELNNYKGAASVLQLTQDMSKREFEKTFQGRANAPLEKKKTFQNRMGTLNEKMKEVSGIQYLGAPVCVLR